MWLEIRRKKRLRKFEEQLPDVLNLLSGSMRAGFSFAQGLEAVADEAPEPSKRELQRAFAESRLGRPIEDALEDSANRMHSVDLTWAVMAIRIQREVGGNLAELLDTVARTMTERERLKREILTLTAEGRMSGWILGVFPLLFGLLLYMVQPAVHVGAVQQPRRHHRRGRVGRDGLHRLRRGCARSWRSRSDVEPLVIAAIAVGAILALGLFTTSIVVERGEVRDSLRRLEGYQIQDVRDQEMLAPISERLFAPALAGVGRLTQRFTPQDYRERVARKLVLAGNPKSLNVDQILVRKLFGLVSIVVVGAAHLHALAAGDLLVLSAG